jgi:hypothetical protein
MKPILAAVIAAATLGACAGQQQAEAIDHAGIDRHCTIGAQDKVRTLAHLEPEDARSLITDNTKPYNRTVEVDTTNGKLKVTYVFVCVTNPAGYVFVKSVGVL